MKSCDLALFWALILRTAAANTVGLQACLSYKIRTWFFLFLIKLQLQAPQLEVSLLLCTVRLDSLFIMWNVKLQPTYKGSGPSRGILHVMCERGEHHIFAEQSCWFRELAAKKAQESIPYLLCVKYHSIFVWEMTLMYPETCLFPRKTFYVNYSLHIVQNYQNTKTIDVTHCETFQ